MAMLLLRFFGGVALVSLSSIVVSAQIERLGARLRLSAGMLGVVAALGADAPEISSAMSAMASGHRDVGVGVVLGSNVYNLAVLLGLSALLAPRGVGVGRRGLWLNGGVAFAITAVAALLILHVFSPAVALAVSIGVMTPYVLVLSMRETHVDRAPLPRRVKAFLCAAVVNVERDTRRAEQPRRANVVDELAIVPALVTVVVASFWMVDGAIGLGAYFHVPAAIVGLVVLSVLTGIPNTVAAVRLARHGRGAAVLSEALNSSSINVVAGLCVPAVVLGASHAGRATWLSLAWLGGATVAALLVGSRRSGLRAPSGALLLGLYAAFVVAVVFV